MLKVWVAYFFFLLHLKVVSAPFRILSKSENSALHEFQYDDGIYEVIQNFPTGVSVPVTTEFFLRRILGFRQNYGNAVEMTEHLATYQCAITKS
jgi:hypothetical protein